MNPERFLGRDPAPGGLVAVDEGAAALRETVILLAEGRGRLDATVVDSPWRGPRAGSVVEAVTDLRTRLDVLETAVADFAAAWQEWRHGLARRQDRVAELVEVVSQLDGDDARRGRVDAEVAALEEEHLSASRALVTAADELAAAAGGGTDESDVAADLRRGLADLDAAVDGWVAASGARVERAGAAVAAVASLTSVVPHLLGASGPTDDPRVRELASDAPGSHRLLDALEHPADLREPEAWPAASFAPARGPSLADRLRGGAPAQDAGGEA